MIDIIAQSGRYPANATGLDQFMVDGEQRYWVHVAIDRFTGQVIDRQVEVVKQ
jgi:very-short-patch-repair endonuclease